MFDEEKLIAFVDEKLIAYYAKFGFVDERVSDKSVHGGGSMASDAINILKFNCINAGEVPRQ